MVEFRLRIGNVVLGLWFESARDAEAFVVYVGRPSETEPADLNLVIRFRDDVALHDDGVPNSLFLTKVGTGEGFETAHGLLKGRYSAVLREGELSVQRVLIDGGFIRAFEQIFFQAYWSVVRQKGLSSFLLHAAGAVRDELGFAFCGPSGAGKSTIAKLSLKHAQILNDEISVIDLSTPPQILDTPFNGFFTAKSVGSAPLSGILLLKQAPHHRVVATKTAEAIKALAREVVPPLALEDAPRPGLFMEMVDLAEKARDRIPLYYLEFLPDPGFWAHVDSLRRMK